MGGGGFTMEPNNPLLDDFVLGLAPLEAPRILFLPTASGDANAQINAFQARFAQARFDGMDTSHKLRNAV